MLFKVIEMKITNTQNLLNFSYNLQTPQIITCVYNFYKLIKYLNRAYRKQLNNIVYSMFIIGSIL